MLAVAERLDTLAGIFAVGMKPSGNKDPFALRRNALGLARTIIESGFDLDMKRALGIALMRTLHGMQSLRDLQSVQAIRSAREAGLGVDPKLPPKEAVDAETLTVELYDFILDRLRGYYADKGVPATHFNAVAELKPASLYDFDRRIDAIGTFAQLPEAEALAAANKRIRNILRKVEAPIPAAVDAARLDEPAERLLHEALAAALADTDPLLAQRDYVGTLKRLAALQAPVDNFFDRTLVMAEDPAVRDNRLALLFIRGEAPLMLAVPRVAALIPRVAQKSYGGNYDRKLFAKLRKLRKAIADEENIPPYVVFNDATLIEMAEQMPLSASEMLSVNGVGTRKLERFGKEFMALIRSHADGDDEE